MVLLLRRELFSWYHELNFKPQIDRDQTTKIRRHYSGWFTVTWFCFFVNYRYIKQCDIQNISFRSLLSPLRLHACLLLICFNHHSFKQMYSLWKPFLCVPLPEQFGVQNDTQVFFFLHFRSFSEWWNLGPCISEWTRQFYLCSYPSRSSSSLCVPLIVPTP